MPTVVGYIRGKPPHETFVVDLHVRNALERPLWLAHVLEDPFPLKVYTVSVSRTASGKVGPLWSFADASVEAVRVAAGADFTLRGVQFDSFASGDLATVWVLDEVRLDGRPAVEWVGKPSEEAAREDVNLEELRASHEIPSATGARLELQVRCTQRFDARDPKLQKP